MFLYGAQSWLCRLVLIPLGIKTWIITKNIGYIPIKDISWLYLMTYCTVTLAFIGYMLLTSESYEFPEGDRVSVIPYYMEVGLGISLVLTALYPLVVITHWLFCSKREWHNFIVFPAYVLILLCIWETGKYKNIFSKIFSLKNFVIASALFHILPCLVANNYWGIIASVLITVQILTSYLEMSETDVKDKVFANAWASLIIAWLLTTSFTMMMLGKLTLESDSKSYYQSVMSYVGAGKYVGDVEYHCYGTKDFFGVQVRS